MAQTISIGKQDFLYLRENNYFYIDKTDFIRQWWELSLIHISLSQTTGSKRTVSCTGLIHVNVRSLLNSFGRYSEDEFCTVLNLSLIHIQMCIRDRHVVVADFSDEVITEIYELLSDVEIKLLKGMLQSGICLLYTSQPMWHRIPMWLPATIQISPRACLLYTSRCV